MAKLDEVAAVLTEEVEDFKQTTETLKKQLKSFSDIDMDTKLRRIHIELEKIEQQNKHRIEHQYVQQKAIDKALAASKIIPKWWISTMLLLFISAMITIGVLAHKNHKLKNEVNKRIEKPIELADKP